GPRIVTKLPAGMVRHTSWTAATDPKRLVMCSSRSAAPLRDPCATDGSTLGMVEGSRMPQDRKVSSGMTPPSTPTLSLGERKGRGVSAVASLAARRPLPGADGGADAAEMLVDVVDQDPLDHLRRGHGLA